MWWLLQQHISSPCTDPLGWWIHAGNGGSPLSDDKYQILGPAAAWLCHGRWVGSGFSPCCWRQPLDCPSGCSLARALSKCQVHTQVSGCAQHCPAPPGALQALGP